jgi:hypothetical protein
MFFGPGLPRMVFNWDTCVDVSSHGNLNQHSARARQIATQSCGICCAYLRCVDHVHNVHASFTRLRCRQARFSPLTNHTNNLGQFSPRLIQNFGFIKQALFIPLLIAVCGPVPSQNPTPQHWRRRPEIHMSLHLVHSQHVYNQRVSHQLNGPGKTHEQQPIAYHNYQSCAKSRWFTVTRIHQQKVHDVLPVLLVLLSTSRHFWKLLWTPRTQSR